MNMFFKNKKQPQPDEFEVINSENKVSESTPSIVNSVLSKNDENEENSPKSKNDNVDYCDSDHEFNSNKLYEYSSSLMDSISLNMYSESDRQEFKSYGLKFMKSTWENMKQAYNYVAELNEDYVTKELQKGTIFERTSDKYYCDVGLDVSI